MTTNLDAIKTIKKALATGKVFKVKAYHGTLTVGPYNYATGEKACAAFHYGSEEAQRWTLRFGLERDRIGSPDKVAAYVLELCGRNVNSQIKRAFGW